jgi:hypothetical protein
LDLDSRVLALSQAGIQKTEAGGRKSALRPPTSGNTLASGFRLLYSDSMFDTITAEIGTAADKLAHLRRFL